MSEETSAPAKARAPKPKKERDPLAGLRAQPKLKGLLLNTDPSLALVHKTVSAAVEGGKLDAAETREATRLLARLAARGVGS